MFLHVVSSMPFNFLCFLTVLTCMSVMVVHDLQCVMSFMVLHSFLFSLLYVECRSSCMLVDNLCGVFLFSFCACYLVLCGYLCCSLLFFQFHLLCVSWVPLVFFNVLWTPLLCVCVLRSLFGCWLCSLMLFGDLWWSLVVFGFIWFHLIFRFKIYLRTLCWFSLCVRCVYVGVLFMFFSCPTAGSRPSRFK